MPDYLKRFSRSLRSNPSEAEKKLWLHLKRKQLNGWKFRRQVPIEGYIADFVFYEHRLIIELDGGQHDEDRENDRIRTGTLESKGFLVLRFWNNDVFNNMDGVLETIIKTVHPHPALPLQGEGKES